MSVAERHFDRADPVDTQVRVIGPEVGLLALERIASRVRERIDDPVGRSEDRAAEVESDEAGVGRRRCPEQRETGQCRDSGDS